MNTTTQPRSQKQKLIFKVISEKKQQLVQEKDADNIWRVLYKSFSPCSPSETEYKFSLQTNMAENADVEGR